MSKLVPPSRQSTIAISGGFDPIHVGHVRMIVEASQFGNVYVILNSDAWLVRKKGYAFMNWEERAEIISSIKGVAKGVHANAEDGTVCSALSTLKKNPDIDLDYFANGGDRIDKNTPEMSLCSELGIEMLWNIGGGKIQSSSSLVENIKGGSSGSLD